jgi:two-component system nitrate/nitrite response regulator NarL
VTSVVVVSSIRLYSEGLANLLRREPGMEVVGAIMDGGAAVEFVEEVRPDIVLVDMATPDSAPMISAMVEAVPDLKVVALGVAEDAAPVLACAEAGAAGYVPRAASIRDLMTILHGVTRNELHCPPTITASLFQRLAAMAGEHRDHPGPSARLTSRELEILALVHDGLSNKQIARRLSIELSTVKNHVHNILRKLETRGRAQAAALVMGSRSRPYG